MRGAVCGAAGSGREFLERRLRKRQPTGNVNMTDNGDLLSIAAAAMALMVSGFPMLLGFAFPDRDDAVALGAIAFAATLFRAPLVVVLQSVQGRKALLGADRDGPTSFTLEMAPLSR